MKFWKKLKPLKNDIFRTKNVIFRNFLGFLASFIISFSSLQHPTNDSSNASRSLAENNILDKTTFEGATTQEGVFSNLAIFKRWTIDLTSLIPHQFFFILHFFKTK